MGPAVNQFLDLLESRGVIAPHDVESLREQVSQAENAPHASFVARRLVQLGYLNPYFAKTLLGEIITENAASRDPQTAGVRHAPNAESSTAPPSEEEELARINASQFPDLGRFDLMSDDRAKDANLIPGLKSRRGLTALFRSSHLQLDQPLGWQKCVRPAAIAAGLLCLALVFYNLMKSL